MIWGGADVIRLETKCTINVMGLNHPQTTALLLAAHRAPQICEKIVLHRTSPWYQKGWLFEGV